VAFIENPPRPTTTNEKNTALNQTKRKHGEDVFRLLSATDKGGSGMRRRKEEVRRAGKKRRAEGGGFDCISLRSTEYLRWFFCWAVEAIRRTKVKV
jgi:hypothetical protein